MYIALFAIVLHGGALVHYEEVVPYVGPGIHPAQACVMFATNGVKFLKEELPIVADVRWHCVRVA